MSGANLARARLAGAGRFLAVLAIAYVGVFRGFALSEQSGGWAGFALAVAALVAAGAMSGRWTALAIPFLLACVGPGLKAGGALVEGQLYESDPDDSDGRSNAALAVVGLILGLAAAVPATVPVAAGVLLRRLASRALRSRREDAVSPSGRTRWGYPAQGVVIAVVTALVFGGTALATALAEPPPTSGGNSPAPPVSCPGVPPFEAYYVGSTSGGLPLDEATRSCEAGGGSVGFEYGDCDSCRDIPLEIHTMPTCEGFVQDEQNLDLLSDGRDPQDDSYVRTRILGAPAVRIDGGSGASLYFEVYTGSTAISIDGSSRRHVERAVRALRRVPGKYVPLEDSEPLDEFEPVPAPPVRRLRPPPPGLFEGKVCTAIAEARERRLERKREGRRGEARGAAGRLDER